jgi:bifunctional non-homologous end joining protein LigD
MITHPDKILFPDDGITKGDVAAYYEALAPVIIPHLVGRPITMERYPSGIGEQGFWQKDVSRGFPAWLQRVEVPKKDGVVHHPLVTDTRSLLWITNQNTITQHVWTSRTPRLEYPDLCVFDLDPPAAGSSEIRAADRLTQEFSKAARRGRIYVDTGRNGYGATFAAPYTLRARRGAPVSAPCTWEEVERGDVHPGSFTLRNLPGRIEAVGDLWAGLRRRGRSLRQPLEKLRRHIGDERETAEP